MIVLVLSAGIITTFVKNDTTTTPAAGSAPTTTPSVAVTVTPTVEPTSSVEASRRLAARSGVKTSPNRVPLLPASGVADHPIGLLLLAIGGAISLWVRRAARA
jgi:hypothetical protein